MNLKTKSIKESKKNAKKKKQKNKMNKNEENERKLITVQYVIKNYKFNN